MKKAKAAHHLRSLQVLKEIKKQKMIKSQIKCKYNM